MNSMILQKDVSNIIISICCYHYYTFSPTFWSHFRYLCVRLPILIQLRTPTEIYAPLLDFYAPLLDFYAPLENCYAPHELLAYIDEYVIFDNENVYMLLFDI
ncbi:MAG: hypothetical protein Q8N88_00705 [Nanoarchaeota archaeon]|nr:hypothetical protein [Nanoarchaeota archaeon]